MCSMSMNLNPKQSQSLKQLQRLIFSPQMQQAIHLMQVPIMELSELLEHELEQNPILEVHEPDSDEVEKNSEDEVEGEPEQELSLAENDFEIMKRLDDDFREHFAESENYYTKRTAEDEKRQTFLEQSVQAGETLFEHLMRQAKEVFETPEEMKMAEAIIGNFDESGYFHTPLKEIALLNNFSEESLAKVLDEVKKFDPHGVGASSLQESLLIQLRSRKWQDTLAYQIIEQYYEYLLNNNIPVIIKGLETTAEAIREAVEHQISLLDLHPGTLYSGKIVQHIYPDVTLSVDEDKFTVTVNDDYLPMLRLNRRYMRMLEDESLPSETREYIRNKVVSAKWFLKNIDQRNNTIYRIVEALATRQKDFFWNPNGKLVPLTMKVLADELDLHESTVARAVSNKYVDSPRGLFSLRHFFTYAYTTSEGDEISSKTVREVLKRVIDGENKKKPLSDEALSKLLQKKGVACARRTVAKYRTAMNIGSARQRRQY